MNRLDGVIYSATAALGFAAIENIFYLSQNNPLLVLLRGPLSNPGHALFSSFWGLSLSRAKSAPNYGGSVFRLSSRLACRVAAAWHFRCVVIGVRSASVILYFMP